MADRIHTSKVLNNTYFSSDKVEIDFGNSPIAVSPLISDQYDYAMTEDIVLLNERKDNAAKIHDIFVKSPYAEKFYVAPPEDIDPDDYENLKSSIIKIPKENIKDIFYYIKDKFEKLKSISAYEFVLAINEYFDFNYQYVVDKVISPQMKAEILDDYYYNMGMKDRMDETAAEPLF